MEACYPIKIYFVPKTGVQENPTKNSITLQVKRWWLLFYPLGRLAK